MSVPTPSGYDVYWEKWIDAFEQEDNELEEEIQEMHEMLANEDLIDESNEDMDLIKHSVSHIRSIVTPFGVLPLTEQTRASNYFKLWVGHSNFKLTEDFYKVIGQQPGIEALDILTPYRFRIAVGKMFTDRDVMKDVRDKMVSHIRNDSNDGDEKQQSNT
tara:strand:+ start:5531 stop:6010 length:480 start_codon:yes stop_codon:yes gene_type:complete